MARNIPTDFLRSFVVIAELGSFTQAGNQLARSQSAISLQIKKLEELLGQKIFDRKGHNFQLTPTGETLMPYARQILQLNDRLMDDLDQKVIEGKVRLGIPSEFATALLPKIVGKFSRENPQIALEVKCDLSRNLNLDIKQNKYDLILSLVDDPSQVKGEYIRRDKLVWVVSPEYYLDNITTFPLIVAPEGCIYRNRAINTLNRCRVPWQIIYTIMDIAGIKAAIEEGLGITVLAESTVPQNLKTISSSEQLEKLGDIGISLISYGVHMSDATRALADYLKQYLE
ncbi:hypothetical protein AB835_07835 [Candidatus Endobugula sertula]|uniref:HTH lysR-type domain-containing protein n=1 Tax=Candidatus Endobugula sertula TaxID=62101 RepID=A0A1D2QPV9_9GAMM|nr:hypothetical protein AB835_07835 [Candidatus Endobugula sertula]